MRRLILLTLFATTLLAASSALAQSGPYSYYPLTPCRIADTRGPAGVNSGPILGNNSSRDFQIRSKCGVPTTAKAVSLNITTVGATAQSFLSVWPSGQARPLVSMLNFDQTDPALANGIIVGLSTATLDLSVYNATGNVHVLIDVTGYFQ